MSKRHNNKPTGTLVFENLLGLDWRNMDGDAVDVIDELRDWLTSSSVIVHIGTDAQKAGTKDRCNYVVCVVVHDPVGRSGSRVFYHKFNNIETHDLWSKLSNETLLSCTAASEISNAIDDARDRILVHVDANPNTLYASSDHVKTLNGMVLGYGFNYVCKPDSWCASHTADHLVKNKNKRNK